MEKIINSDFRKEALGLLIEAGVEKDKAVKVISSKYEAALKGATITYLEKVVEELKGGTRKLSEIIADKDTLKGFTGFESFAEIASQLTQLEPYIDGAEKAKSGK